MILGLTLSAVAGLLAGVQNVFNGKVNEKAGVRATTPLVLGLGFAASLAIGLVAEGRSLFDLANMRPWFWFSGVLGVGVVACLTRGIGLMGPANAIRLSLASQLTFALLADTFGWLGLPRMPFTGAKLLGVVFVIAGAALFLARSRSAASAEQ